MTKKLWFLPIVCLFFILGWTAPSASAGAPADTNLYSRLAVSTAGGTTLFRKLPQLSSLRLRIRRHITKKLPEKAEQP